MNEITMIVVLLFVVACSKEDTIIQDDDPQTSIITIDKTTLELSVGHAEQRTRASDVFGKTIQWSSSDNARVPVDAQGVVTSQRAGTAILTAKVDNAQSTCKVTVNPDIYVAGHIGNT